jgi:hypothetical protein
MLSRITCLLAIMLCIAGYTYAQPLTAYTNLQNQVQVWDNGVVRKIDYLPPVGMKIGRTAIPYLDNSRSFKIYSKGGVQKVNIGFTNDFFVSDNLLGYINARSLNVFDNGKITNLSGLVQDYYMGDSVLLFFDGVRREYKCYYNGTVYPIENFLADSAIKGVAVSDNIVAYDNYANQFRIFYQGNIIQQENYVVNSFGVGRNTCAYIDLNREFRIFHKGETFVVEDYPPLSFAVGDDLVAYVSQDGYFKIFYEDSVRNIGFFKPEYKVGDWVVAYRDAGGYFRCFHKGEITTLETYYPDSYTIQYNSIAWLNRMNMLRLFTDGEVYDVTSLYSSADAGAQNSWLLSYDVLRYEVGKSYFKVFYKGVDY